MAQALPFSSSLAEAIATAIRTAAGSAFRIESATAIGGGCISANFRVDSGGQRFFVKTGRAAAPMFAAEADGLDALARCAVIIVPQVVARGSAGDTDFLVLDWLDLQPHGDDACLGEAVAALHSIALPRFGWRCDNFIGRTPQANGEEDDWPRFFADRRLRPQLALAARRGASDLEARATALLAALPRLLAGHTPTPALVHGDLWRGNCGFVNGQPALFDPAVYAGDGETDLAMAGLFGGFSPRFFAAYAAALPAANGSATRQAIYQLYHVLNHYNLFGGGYADDARARLAAIPA